MITKTFDLRGDASSRLDAYVLNHEISYKRFRTRPAVLIIPGGGYLTRATREQELVAARFLGFGYHAFVLQYATYFVERPEGTKSPVLNEGAHFPAPLIDLMTAMRIINDHAEEWDIDKSRIYVLGFSAGGHLAGSLAEKWDQADLLNCAHATAEQTRPAGVLMCYPMISASVCQGLARLPRDLQGLLSYMNQGIFGTDKPSREQMDAIDLRRGVRADMPRTFVWHTAQDEVAPPLETLQFVTKLLEAGVSCEMHLYQTGAHGLVFADKEIALVPEDINYQVSLWFPSALAWLDLDDGKTEYFHR